MNDKDQKQNLERLARENSEATWGETEASRARVPGLISGDVGAKGKVSAQLREQSRTERGPHGEVPYGANVAGTGRYIFALIAGIIIALLALIGVIVWIST